MAHAILGDSDVVQKYVEGLHEMHSSIFSSNLKLIFEFKRESKLADSTVRYGVLQANMGQLLKDKGMSESVVDHERHRLQLEENISKLQKSLQYWQTWEAEYEGLKEEISGLGDRHSLDQLVGRR